MTFRVLNPRNKTPNAGASEAHRPEAEAINLDLATDPK
jgi:hypothetical protein